MKINDFEKVKEVTEFLNLKDIEFDFNYINPAFVIKRSRDEELWAKERIINIETIKNFYEIDDCIKNGKLKDEREWISYCRKFIDNNSPNKDIFSCCYLLAHKECPTIVYEYVIGTMEAHLLSSPKGSCAENINLFEKATGLTILMSDHCNEELLKRLCEIGFEDIIKANDLENMPEKTIDFFVSQEIKRGKEEEKEDEVILSHLRPLDDIFKITKNSDLCNFALDNGNLSEYQRTAIVNNVNLSEEVREKAFSQGVNVLEIYNFTEDMVKDIYFPAINSLTEYEKLYTENKTGDYDKSDIINGLTQSEEFLKKIMPYMSLSLQNDLMMRLTSEPFPASYYLIYFLLKNAKSDILPCFEKVADFQKLACLENPNYSSGMKKIIAEKYINKYFESVEKSRFQVKKTETYKRICEIIYSARLGKSYEKILGKDRVGDYVDAVALSLYTPRTVLFDIKDENSSDYKWHLIKNKSDLNYQLSARLNLFIRDLKDKNGEIDTERQKDVIEEIKEVLWQMKGLSSYNLKEISTNSKILYNMTLTAKNFFSLLSDNEAKELINQLKLYEKSVKTKELKIETNFLINVYEKVINEKKDIQNVENRNFKDVKNNTLISYFLNQRNKILFGKTSADKQNFYKRNKFLKDYCDFCVKNYDIVKELKDRGISFNVKSPMTYEITPIFSKSQENSERNEENVR